MEGVVMIELPAMGDREDRIGERLFPKDSIERSK